MACSALLNAMKLLGAAFKCMKRSDTLAGLNRRYSAERGEAYPARPEAGRGFHPACPDVFTRVAITGLSLLKRGLKAFWPARAGGRERKSHAMAQPRLKANTNAPWKCLRISSLPLPPTSSARPVNAPVLG